MSDTPRMKAAQMAAIEHGTGDVWRVGCQLEHELNAANVEIEEKRKDVVWLATEKAKLDDRIKRLELVGNDMVTEEDVFIRLKIWMKAKETKP